MMNRKHSMKNKWASVFILLAAWITECPACTNLIVGKKASADGSVIVSYSADSFGMFGHLYHSPAATHQQGEMLDIYDWDTAKHLGQIRQVPQTYNVIGNMNQYQVTIGETTFGGREELVDSTGIMDYGSLIYVALQRAASAREAIQVMTDLVQEYGYYSEGESFTIADPNEAWILEMVGKGPGIRGAVWVAVRIPDDCIAAHANQSRIHRFDMDDKENCLYSPDVISFAREKGYFTGMNRDFSFADAYNPLDFGGLRYCEARVWSFFRRHNPEMDSYLSYIKGESSEPMPLYVKPDRKLSVQDIQQDMRDHYEGTPLDMTQDLGAGPYHSPYRPSPLSFKVDNVEYFNERPISTQQSAFTFVAQMRNELPNPVGGVLWFGMDDANMIAYTPVYCCTTEVPPCYAKEVADGVTFSWESAFWVCNWVSNMIYPRYGLMIDDLRQVQEQTESTLFAAQTEIEDKALSLYKESPEKAGEYLTAYTVQTAQNMLEGWKKLGEFLIVKYNDLVVKRMKDGQFERTATGLCAPVIRPGYPEAYSRKVIEETGERYKIPDLKK